MTMTREVEVGLKLQYLAELRELLEVTTLEKRGLIESAIVATIKHLNELLHLPIC